ncbi:Piso0_002684 [Millerozyma farinosa CBS 7064]|uniref:holo-[acyl-carrier-protein] synthase n=1 Tax=Pichia sorbitophila (strain ATCC MYA-4447 / BCRC 22081 / CBS 7064 / NBRC 10061 / NRRL Y-12695) TaxID=559304 RepID=G8YD90_PICSO|nr:Piso0_002684 [Millerozyma farinosa CBS 7064]
MGDIKEWIQALFENALFHEATSIDSSLLLFSCNSGADELKSHLEDDFNFESALRLLSLREQNKVLSVKDQESKFRLLVASLLTRLVLNYFVHRVEGGEFSPLKEIHFSYSKLGKPTLLTPHGSQIQFSSSSSNEIVAIVVQLGSSTPLGLDLSHSRQKISASTIMEDFGLIFSPEEKQQLQSIQGERERYIAFNQLWTLKEAFTKLIGTGLHVDLSSFSFDFITSAIIDGSKETQCSVTRNVVQRYDVEWRNNISVNYEKISNQEPGLDHVFRSKPVFDCVSGIIASHDEFPVIASTIHQNSCPVEYFDIAMHEILIKLQE